jgi:flagellar motor switch protein FliG
MRVLNGRERVAALLLTMGPVAAQKVLQHFGQDEIRAISKAGANLGQISTNQIEDLVDEFSEGFSNGTDLVGNATEIQKLLAAALPEEQVANLMDEVQGNANRSIWERISMVSESAIAAYLLKEHPQTAALIVSKLRPSSAAKVISQLPPEVRSSVSRRMISMNPITEETMRNIEAALHENFVTNFSKDAGSETHAKMASIINKMDRDHQDVLLADIASHRPKSAEILKSMLFTFDDIIKLSGPDRTTLFDQVPADRTSLALKGCKDELREAILASLAIRLRRMVEHEISSLGAVTPRDVTEARRAITDLALEMAHRNEIVIQSENDADMPAY